MYDVFDEIKNILKVTEITTDNNVFQMHYKVTMILLLACSLLTSQRQYFGDPIDCDTPLIDQGIMDTFCWINSTYTLPAIKGHNNVAAGVGANHNIKTGMDHEARHHKYYQWVVIVLFLQAMAFYIPKYIWTACEGGKIKMLAADLNSPIVDDAVKKERKDMLVNYFTDNIHSHDYYAYKFFVCELLNFINVIGQMFFTDKFLGGEFLTYGTKVLSVSEEAIGTRNDPMDLVFPKLAKCTFTPYGSGGSKEIHDALCVLPLNILNEKIYIFLWFWFIIVAVATGLSLVYRLVTILLPAFRTILLRVRSHLSSSENVQDVAHKCSIGDWFLLYLLAKNIDPLIYKEFINELASKMRGNGPI